MLKSFNNYITLFANYITIEGFNILNYSYTIVHHSSALPLLRIWNATVEKCVLPMREHSHNVFEMAVFLSGSAIYRVGEKTYSVNDGDVFVFSSNEQHCITEIKEDLTYCAIHLDPKYLWGSSADSLSSNNTNFCLFHSDSFENRLSSGNSSAVVIKNAILNIADEMKKKDAEYKMMVKNYINQIVVELIRKTDYISQSDTSSILPHIKTIKKVITYIDTHLTEEITLKEISKIAEMSPNYFCSIFKTVHGVTAWDYITSKRCDMAAHLLLSEKNCNIIEIAERCGFNNTANFNKAFRKRTGVTPSQYRKHGDML